MTTPPGPAPGNGPDLPCWSREPRSSSLRTARGLRCRRELALLPFCLLHLQKLLLPGHNFFRLSVRGRGLKTTTRKGQQQTKKITLKTQSPPPRPKNQFPHPCEQTSREPISSTPKPPQWDQTGPRHLATPPAAREFFHPALDLP